MWLNVDHPTKRITLHGDNCKFTPIIDSKYKKVNGLLRDGDWLYFEGLQEEQTYYEENYRDYKYGSCNSCNEYK